MKLAKVSTSHIQAVTGTTFVATLSSLLFGYATAVICRRGRRHRAQFHRAARARKTAANALLGLTVCAALLGTIIGALFARRTAALLGRKRPMILASMLFLVSAVGSAFPEIGAAPVGGMGPDAIWPFNLYRVIGGVAVGLASMIAPMYVGEFAPSAVRGQLGAYQQIAIIGGMTIAYFVNWGIALQGDDSWVLETGWRWMMLSLAIPAHGVLLPELFGARIARAGWSRPGASNRRANYWRARPIPKKCAACSQSSAATSPEEKPAPLFAFGARVVLVGVALSVFQQLVGINAVLYYGPEIFASMGYHMDRRSSASLVARMREPACPPWSWC